uniref:CN hydrolase domain-containing protein n=1 Tax=Paracidobacterium acidisoli TaxID=2303751 RepID=A0A372IUG7_9BACT
MVAGTWQIETNNQATRAGESLDVTGVFSLDTKISTMTRIVTDFYNDAKASLAYTNIPPLFIFVAPEYYFKRTLTQRCLTKDERDRTRDAMSILAQSLPNLLLIPGTVAWRKPLDKKAHAKASERLERRLALDGAYTGARTLPKPSSGGMFGKSKVKADAAYNTAYLYMGTRIMKYHKMEDAGELAEEDEGAIFVPGDGNNVFTVASLRVGIEICADHQAHHLREKVDIHIVSSASVARRDEHVMAKDGGLYIRANTGDAEITKVDRTTTTPLAAAPNTVKTPQIADVGAMDEAFRRRWDTAKDLSKALFTNHPEQKKPKKQSIRELVRLAYGGKLTTAVTEVDTI